MEVSEDGACANHPNLEHSSIETHGDLGIRHFQKPPNGIERNA